MALLALASTGAVLVRRRAKGVAGDWVSGLTDSGDVGRGRRADMTEEARGRPVARAGISGALASADGDRVGRFLAGDGAALRVPRTDWDRVNEDTGRSAAGAPGWTFGTSTGRPRFTSDREPGRMGGSLACLETALGGISTSLTCGGGFVAAENGLRRCCLGFATGDSAADAVSLTDVRLEADDRTGDLLWGLVLSLEESVDLEETRDSGGIAARIF